MIAGMDRRAMLAVGDIDTRNERSARSLLDARIASANRDTTRAVPLIGDGRNCVRANVFAFRCVSHLCGNDHACGFFVVCLVEVRLNGLT